MIEENLDNILDMSRCAQLLRLSGDLPDMLRLLEKEGFATAGQSFGRFITLGNHSLFSRAKMETNIYRVINLDKVKEEETTRYGKSTFAKNVRYNGQFYETGPLARAMTEKTPLLRNMYQNYRDSIVTRIIARIYEIPLLLNECRRLVALLQTGEPSHIPPKVSWRDVTGKGTGVVEAPRGSLIHAITAENGIIRASQIITPTQWNLATSTTDDPGIAQKAMIGLKDTALAEFVFRTFDICSVCTTH